MTWVSTLTRVRSGKARSGVDELRSVRYGHRFRHEPQAGRSILDFEVMEKTRKVLDEDTHQLRHKGSWTISRLEVASELNLQVSEIQSGIEFITIVPTTSYSIRI